MLNLKLIYKWKVWLTISTAMTALAILALAIYGLKFGIDFTGGSLLEIKYFIDRPGIEEVKDALKPVGLNSLTVQPIGEDGLIIRFQDAAEDKHEAVLEALGKKDNSATSSIITATTSQDIVITGIETEDTSGFEELRFDAVGPSIGVELKQKSFWAIIFALMAMVIFIAWAFRKVSKPVASWKFGVAAIIALFHDVMITLGVFAVLGRFLGTEVSAPFIAAILTVLGYSVNDTIVVFDRIRENLPRSSEDFIGTINTSINQTLGRSINTSLTTLLTLGAIYAFGGVSVRDFVLALMIGIFCGAYSSIFLASPLLVVWEKLQRK